MSEAEPDEPLPYDEDGECRPTPEELIRNLESQVKTALSAREYPTGCFTLLEADAATPLPEEIYYFALALLHLDLARLALSHGAQSLVEEIHLATKYMCFGGAILIQRDDRTKMASGAGKESGKVRALAARRGHPILRAYLERAAVKRGDHGKAGIATSAHRMLLKDCERFRQGEAGDPLAKQRFEDRAPSGLGELLATG